MIALGLAAILSGAFAGYAKYQEGETTAAAYESQGRVLQIEANIEASRIEEEGREFAIDQKMMYISSGVEIGGSAVVTLAQTDKWTKIAAENVRSRGRSLRAYSNRSAGISRSQGRAQFMRGIMSGVSNAAMTYGRTAPVKSARTMRQNTRFPNYAMNPMG